MLGQNMYLPLTRRLVGHYLMFGLGSVVTFGLGAVLLTAALYESERERDTQAHLSDITHQVAEDLRLTDRSRWQPLVERLASEFGFVYCAVVTADGHYAAHSNRTRIGTTCPAPHGWLHDQGAVERVRLLKNWSPTFREYRTHLVDNDDGAHYLEIGQLEQQRAYWLHRALEISPAIILTPLMLLYLGGRVLRRTSAPTSEIESQLSAFSASESGGNVELSPIEGHGPAAEGWNRIVGEALSRHLQTNLEDRLNDALGGLKQQKAERILNGLPDGVAVTDSEGRISFANRALRALFNLGDEDLGGKRIMDVVSIKGEQGAAQLREQFAEAARPAIAELRRGQELSEGVLRIARYPLAVDEGGTVSHVWSIRDVTQQKLADEMRTQFVYSATHELRTPLANIKAYAETLALDDISDVEQQKEFLNIINSEATRLARFVDELLNVSRMEAGSLTLDRQETDLERLLSEVIEKVRPQISQKQIDFDTILPQKFPALTVDKAKITAALINLLGNAAKYTPDHGRVTLQVEARDKELQIHVEDSGIGISREELAKVFNKFFRSDDPRVREIAGTGLGLSFVREVVRLHGGKLGVHSELNKGSKFTVTLPIA